MNAPYLLCASTSRVLLAFNTQEQSKPTCRSHRAVAIAGLAWCNAPHASRPQWLVLQEESGRFPHGNGTRATLVHRSDTLMSVSGSNTHALAAFEKSVVQLCSCPRLLLSRVPSSQKRPWHCPADLAADSYRHSRRLMHLTCSVPLPLAFCLHSTHKSRASRHVEAIAPSPSLAWLGATPPMRADRNGWCCRRSQAGSRTAMVRVPHWYIALTRS